MNEPSAKISDSAKRHTFIGGSDARIIMGDDEAALLRLWREKRGEAERADYSRNLLVQLGLATEALNRHWYERTTGEIIKDIQSYPCSFVRRMDFIRMAGVPDHRYKNAVYFCIAHIRESQIDSAKSETVIFGLCLGQLPHHSINGPSMKTGWTNQIQGGGRPVAPSLHTRGMHQLLQKIIALLALPDWPRWRRRRRGCGSRIGQLQRLHGIDQAGAEIVIALAGREALCARGQDAANIGGSQFRIAFQQQRHDAAHLSSR